jgi:hypothetical protein
MKIPRSDKNAKAAYEAFQKAYQLGDLAIVEIAAACSLDHVGIKPLNVIIISPSGTLKSTIIKKIMGCYNSNYVMINSRFTPYGVTKKYKDLAKTWIVNDLVRSFAGQSATKIEETIGWLTELMSEGHAGSDTAMEAELTARMNLIANIATMTYRDVKDQFIKTTFAERVLQFNYTIDKNYVRHAKPIAFPSFKLATIKKFVPLTKLQIKKKFELGDMLTTVGQYEVKSLRPDEMVQAFVYGYARMNNRNEVKNSDFDIFKQLLPKFKRVV